MQQNIIQKTMKENEKRTLKSWALRNIKDEGERTDFLQYCEEQLGMQPNHEMWYLDFEEIYLKGFK